MGRGAHHERRCPICGSRRVSDLPLVGVEHRGGVAGIGVYIMTKAALNRMVETWRSEHPEIGFTFYSSVRPRVGDRHRPT